MTQQKGAAPQLGMRVALEARGRRGEDMLELQTLAPAASSEAACVNVARAGCRGAEELRSRKRLQRVSSA